MRCVARASYQLHVCRPLPIDVNHNIVPQPVVVFVGLSRKHRTRLCEVSIKEQAKRTPEVRAFENAIPLHKDLGITGKGASGPGTHLSSAARCLRRSNDAEASQLEVPPSAPQRNLRRKAVLA